MCEGTGGVTAGLGEAAGLSGVCLLHHRASAARPPAASWITLQKSSLP